MVNTSNNGILCWGKATSTNTAESVSRETSLEEKTYSLYLGALKPVKGRLEITCLQREFRNSSNTDHFLCNRDLVCIPTGKLSVLECCYSSWFPESIHLFFYQLAENKSKTPQSINQTKHTPKTNQPTNKHTHTHHFGGFCKSYRVFSILS